MGVGQLLDYSDVNATLISISPSDTLHGLSIACQIAHSPLIKIKNGHVEAAETGKTVAVLLRVKGKLFQSLGN